MQAMRSPGGPGCLTRRLRLARPLDLRLSLGRLAPGHGDPTLRIDADTVWRATRTPCGPTTLAITVRGMRDVEAQAWGDGAEHALEHLPPLLGEPDDDTGFQPRHPVLVRLRQRFRGLRLVRTGAVFEALLPAVLAQRVTSGEAHTSTTRLRRLLGETAPGPRPDLLLPPSPRRVAALPGWDFHLAGVERQRADTLRRASLVASRLEEAAAMPTADAMQRLQVVRGIGPWTAATTLALALGDPDLVPPGDYNLPHMVSWALAGEPRGSDERMFELLEPYRGHRARVVRLLLVGGARAPRYGPRRAPRDLSRI